MAVVAELRKHASAPAMNRRRCGIDYRIVVVLVLLLSGACCAAAHGSSSAFFVPASLDRHRHPSCCRHRHFDPRQPRSSGPSFRYKKTSPQDILALRSSNRDEGDAAADKKKSIASSYAVQDCSYADLHRVADIILSSFYDKSIMSPWKQLYRMGELNRIQQGFAYPAQRDRHRMLVAVVKDPTASAEVSGRRPTSNGNGADLGRIVGFCDVDGRPPNRPTGFTYNPRPYLSDLCTDPAFRRKGVAKALVEACETYCRDHWNEQFVYIRVESHNEAAIRLYEGMGYRIVDNESEADATAGFAVTGRNDQASSSDKIRLLRKDLRVNATATAVDQQQEFSIADQGP